MIDMAEKGTEVNRFAQRTAATLAALAISAGGAVWVGCGGSNTSDKVNKARDNILQNYSLEACGRRYAARINEILASR